jgi:site-specific DNA recombinase
MVTATSDVVTVLATADPADKADLFGQLGLRLTYNTDRKTVTARAEVGRICSKESCPRGDLNPHALLGH